MLGRSIGLVAGLTFVSATLSAFAADISFTVQDSKGQPVSDAVVFIQSDSFSGSSVSTKMVQRNENFNPFVLPIAVGTKVEFPNEDPFRHHVYSFSPAKQFEIKLYGGEEVQEVTFEKSGEVALGCNIHDNMLGYIYVVDTDLFGKTGKDGTVTISGLAEGVESEAQVWHPRLRGPARRTAMSVTAGQSATFEIRLKPDRRSQSGNDFEQGDY